VKSDEPRVHVAKYGWPVDLARDEQTNCASCGAACYWVKIERKKDGKVVPMLLSEATAKRLDGVPHMAAHFSDCPHAERHRR